MLKHGILGLLNYSDMTGYEIMELFRDSLNYFWSAQTSQIYRELQTLKTKGWVDSRTQEQRGKPDKNIFSLTEEGRTELLRWLGEELPGNTREPLLMKVFFLGERPREENRDFFRKLRIQSEQVLEGLRSADRSVEHNLGNVDDPVKTLYWEMTLHYGRKKLEMIRDWCRDCEDMLGTLPEEDIQRKEKQG